MQGKSREDYVTETWVLRRNGKAIRNVAFTEAFQEIV